MRAARLQDALERLTTAIRDVEVRASGNESRTRPTRVAHLCFAPLLSERQRAWPPLAHRADRPVATAELLPGGQNGKNVWEPKNVIAS